MGRVVVIEAQGTDGFVQRLQQVWDAGDAVLPLDPRLPGPARDEVLAAAHLGDPTGPDDALVVATSGTTGRPKAAVLTHDAVAASARATSARLGVDPGRDRWLACLPLAHVGGLGVVTRALATGVRCTVVGRADPDRLRDAAEIEGCTLVSLVPTLLDRLDPALFRTILLGGSSMPGDLPANVVTTYGMTETGGGVVYDGEPLDGVEVRVAAGGEVEVRGPMTLRCYRDGTDPRDAGGWLPTGDAGSWDPATGRLRVQGRMGDVIVTGGEKVWPVAVEEVLGRHPAVAEVMVFGRADPEWGERVVARVVPADRSAPPPLQDLRRVVGAVLPRWAAPRELELAERLPRTALGKLVRRPESL